MYLSMTEYIFDKGYKKCLFINIVIKEGNVKTTKKHLPSLIIIVVV